MDLSLLNCVRKAFIGLAAIGLATFWSTGALAGSLSISGGVCPTLPEGGHGYCTDIILTNSSTATTLDGNGNPFLVLASGDSGIFTVGTSYNADKNGVTGCKQNLTLQAGQKCRIEVRYRPVYYRATPHWVRYNVISTGYAPQIYISGQSILAGTVTLSAPTCPTVTTLNQTVTCGNIMVTAQNAPVQFGGEYGTYSWVSGDSSQWVISTPTDSTRCNGNVMQPGQSCALATVSFRPKSYGTHSITYKTDLYAGTDQNVTVSGTANPPYTYSWSTGSWDTCSGGTGTWSYSAWSPASGCGSVTQTRTATCNPNAGTGSQSRSVTCLRSDGVTVADSFCTGTKPATTQSCTPTTGYSCGTQGSTSQTVTLTNSCTGTASLSSVSCGNTGVGTSKNCGTMTVTASGGPILLGSTLYTTSGTTSQFSLGAPSSGACSANQTLASGASCNLRTITHQPTSAGSATMTVTVTPAGGNAGSKAISGTGVWGSAAVSASGLSCSGPVGIASVCSGDITVTATNGQIVLGNPVFALSGSNPGDFSVATSVGGACSAGQTLNSGSSCKLGPVTFTAGAGGARSATITVTPSSGSAGSATLSGNGSYGTASISVSGVSCSGTVGIAANCSGTAKITATNGQVKLNATPITKSGSHTSDFTVANGNCGGATLNSGSSCNLGTITFTAGAAGTRSVTLTTSVANGSSSSTTLSGTGTAAGAASVSSVSCGTAGIGTTKSCSGTVTVTASGGSIQLGSTVYSTSGSTSEFTTAAPSTNACTANQVLSNGSSVLSRK